MRTDSEEMPVEAIARIVHNAQRDLQEWLNDPYPSQVWDSLDTFHRIPAMNLVRLIQAGFPPEYVQRMWVDVMTDEGWVRGDIKDPVKKTHPCMVSWDDLPFWEKQKLLLAFVITERMTKGISD